MTERPIGSSGRRRRRPPGTGRGCPARQRARASPTWPVRRPGGPHWPRPDLPLADRRGTGGRADPRPAALAGLAAAWSAAVAGAELRAALGARDGTRERLLACSAIAALADHLVRHPDHWRSCSRTPAAVGPARAARPAGRPRPPRARARRPTDALRVAYRRPCCASPPATCCGAATVELTALRLSDLADCGAVDAALAVAREPSSRRAPPPARLAVIGDGQVRRPRAQLHQRRRRDLRRRAGRGRSTRPPPCARRPPWPRRVMRAVGQPTAEGAIWEVDAEPAPRGPGRGAGAHAAQPRRLLRALGQDLGVPGAAEGARRSPATWSSGAAYVDAVAALRVVGRRPRRASSTTSRPCAAGSSSNVPAKDADRQLKLGRGGLRDVEFGVQLLQLVHGRSDVMLRSPTTLTRWSRWPRGGTSAATTRPSSAGAYRFLRTLEHRIQLHRHAPHPRRARGEDEDLRRLGRSMGFMADPGEELVEAWQRQAREVRRIHEKLFYRPLLDAVARLDRGQARLTPQAAAAAPGGARLRRPGRGAAPHRGAHLRGEPPGGDPADAAAGDARLVRRRPRPRCRAARRSARSATPWGDALVPAAAARRVGAAAERMARVLATSRYATDLLLRAPEAVALLADDAELRPRPSAAADRGARRRPPRYDDAGRGGGAPCARCAVASCSGSRPPTCSGRLTVERGRQRAHRRRRRHDLRRPGDRDAGSWRRAPGSAAARPGCWSIGMGRFGGGEIGYGSDADVAVRARPAARASTSGRRPMPRTRSPTRCAPCSRCPVPDPPLQVDTDLRPEGKQGPLGAHAGLVRCLLRPLVAPSGRPRRCCAPTAVAGDADARRAVRAGIDPLRWPGRRVGPTGRARDPPAQGPDGERAAAARRRPDAAHQARSRRALRRRVDQSSCCSCSTRTGSPSCAPPARWTRSRRRSAHGPARARGRRRALRRRGGWPPGCATR